MIVEGRAAARRFGDHEIWREGDMAVAHLVGAFELEDSRRFHGFLDELHAEVGPAFLVADVVRMTGLGAEVRRHAMEWNRQRKLRAVAVCGASLAVRVMASMLTHAIRLVTARADIPVEFFKTEAEARRWIEGLRAGAP